MLWWLASAWAEEPTDEDLDDVEEIVVEGKSAAEEDTHARTTLDEGALAKEAGSDLAEAVASVPGVVAARGNGDNTKPILRGQTERRLLVLFDGVRHESQKWGQDHATEIDPFAAGSIDVVKGAAGVRYGPDAIGGVVLVEPPPLRDEVGLGGKVQLVGVSNGWRGVAAGRVDGVLEKAPGLTFRLEGNYGRGASLHTPDYVLGNTASITWNLGATIGARVGLSTLTASWRHYDFLGGVCYCVGAESPDDFLDRLDDPVPVGSEDWTTSYTIDRPYQQVAHDLAMLRGAFPVGSGNLQLTYAFQLDHREEAEPVRGADTAGAQYDFVLRTHSLDGWLGHGAHVLGEGTHEGGFGFDASFQENVYAGLPLIPNFRALSGGVYAIERWHVHTVVLEAGARVDHLDRQAFLTDDAFSRHVDRGTLAPEDCEPGDNSVRCASAWTGGSLSLGALWRPSEQVETRLDLSSANRFPNADEQYMNGSAPTSPVYALGDPSLGVETTWGASPTLGWDLRWVRGEASVYGNLIQNYIYFAPALGPDGAPAFDVTIRGAYPRYDFRPIDAMFYGGDGQLELLPDAVIGATTSVAIVRAVDLASGSGLVMIPPDRVRGALLGRPRIRGFDEAVLQANVTWVARQTHVDEEVDLAPPPDGYVLVGAAASAEVPMGHDLLRVGVEGNNLLDARYREYTSLLRYSADEPGREVRLRVGMDL
ncbi:MAG: TonB-dependent receptor [Myxococcales bacterium]|nr:TonB-dependent receptor [Myxococcales bacterium]